MESRVDLDSSLNNVMFAWVCFLIKNILIPRKSQINIINLRIIHPLRISGAWTSHFVKRITNFQIIFKSNAFTFLFMAIQASSIKQQIDIISVCACFFPGHQSSHTGKEKENNLGIYRVHEQYYLYTCLSLAPKKTTYQIDE